MAPVTRYMTLDDVTIRALERHETQAHAIPSREMRDLGDAYVLYDARDRDPFWNRMASVRWPSAPDAFDLRLAEALALFGVLGRVPHIWPSPRHSAPADLVERLRANGFSDAGEGHVMVLAGPGRPRRRPCRRTSSAPGVTLLAVHGPDDAQPGDLDDVGLVLAESFGAPPARAAELAADLRLTLPDDAGAARARARRRGAGRGRQGDDVRRVHLPVVDRDARGVPRPRARADS